MSNAIRIELTGDELAALREALTLYLNDFRRQVAGTENPAFRHQLQRRQSVLEGLAERLDRPAAA